MNAIECTTPDEKYLESLGDESDLLGTDKVEKHSVHTHGKASKFLIINVTFDVSTLIEQIKSTCRG